jgi:hypothetical protein
VGRRKNAGRSVHISDTSFFWFLGFTRHAVQW